MRPKIDRPHWSHSAINQFLKCPLQYYFERILRLPRRTSSDAQVLGSAIHAALAHYHRSLQQGEPIQAHHLHDAFLSAWADQISQVEVVYDKRSADDNLALGIALIDAYLQEPPPENIMAVEALMLAPIATSHGEVLEKPLMVVIDLITRRDDDQPRITEFKTTSRAFSESEVATSLQPTCYASALYELTGEEPLVDYVALVKSKTPKVQRIETIRTVEDFARLGNIIGAVEKAVEANAYYPVESPLNCSSCHYYRECRGWTGPKSGHFGADGVPVAEEAVPCSSR